MWMSYGQLVGSVVVSLLLLVPFIWVASTSAGAVIGAFFPEYIGITLSAGMLIGLLIGMAWRACLLGNSCKKKRKTSCSVSGIGG